MDRHMVDPQGAVLGGHIAEGSHLQAASWEIRPGRRRTLLSSSLLQCIHTADQPPSERTIP